MSILHIGPEAARDIPPLQANNNSWRVYRGTGSVIVFVHGVLSSALACWYNPKAKTFWPDMVAADSRKTFADSSVFIGGYYTAFNSTNFALADCARQLLTALFAAEDHPAVLAHPRLIFVCHSLGGIVVRYMLERWKDDFKDKKIGIALMASPSLGSETADISAVSEAIHALGHRVGMQLAWRSETLVELHVRFREMLQRGVPEIRGMEAYEHRAMFYHWYSAPFLPGPIVPYVPGGVYFTDAHLVAETDHVSIVKPPDENHESHQLLRDFYTRALGQDFKLPAWIPPAQFRQAADPRGAALGETNAFACGRICWDIAINEDGDAPNELCFDAISDARSGGAREYPLTPTWVQSGQTSRFEVDLGRSSEQVTLTDPAGSQRRLIRQTARFGIPPTAAHRLHMVLHSIDFNVYSMDLDEFRRKETETNDGLDYLQKNIRWESLDELIMVIRFPEAMRLQDLEPVSAKGFQLIHADDADLEVFDEHLTGEIQSGFYYSPLLRSAFLRVKKPSSWSAYRISWKLNAPAVRPSNDAQVALVAGYRDRLIAMRPLFDGTKPPAGTEAQKKEGVLRAMAQFGARAVAEINRALDKLKPGAKAQLNVGQLDLSLMAIAATTGTAPHEVLRVVAGMNVPPEYWELELPVGDGIAGRAAKRVQTRKFFRSEQPSLANDAYVPFQESRQHVWLLSIPLCEPGCVYPYGVINLGAFDVLSAKILNALDEKSIAGLTCYANGEFLRSLLAAV